MKIISQREAKALRRRVSDLEAERDRQRSSYVSDWPGGTNISTVDLVNLPAQLSAIKTARMLGHAVVAVNNGTSLLLYALPLPKSAA